jgi:hypothetical protein
MKTFNCSYKMIKKRSYYFAILCICLLSGIFMAEATNYYLDQHGQTNGGNGSINSPWNHIDTVNNHTFNAGDTLFIKRGNSNMITTSSPARRTSTGGATLFGVLAPIGSGTTAQQIVIDAYGTGANPIIDAQGKDSSAAILLYNQDCWTIQNIAVTNNDIDSTRNLRWGILVYFYDFTRPYNNIIIKNNTVSNVYGSYFYSDSYGNRLWYDLSYPLYFASMSYAGGIFIIVEWPSAGASLNNVQIIGNNVSNITGTGISINSPNLFWDELATNVVISHNTVTTTCDGIVIHNSNNPLIEYNIVDNAGGAGKPPPLPRTHADSMDGHFAKSHGTAAINALWLLGCSRGIIQYNEVMNTKLVNTDGQALSRDSWQSDTCIFQYNYTHNNEGGFFGDCPLTTTQDQGTPVTIVRYNISQNDGLGHYENHNGQFYTNDNIDPFDSLKYHAQTFEAQRGNGSKIYNNVIYTTGTIRYRIENPPLPYPPVIISDTISFINNIFYGTSSEWEYFGGADRSAAVKYYNNCFYGGVSLPASGYTNDNYRTEDPLFINAGAGGNGLSSAQCYKLKGASKCINAGLTMSNNGGHDFFGIHLYNRMPEIGAYEQPNIIPILDLLLGD